tara:strand:- start:819 stop:1772 length:954 start_codon:yes stop_codon:yes gene_type:complete
LNGGLFGGAGAAAAYGYYLAGVQDPGGFARDHIQKYDVVADSVSTIVTTLSATTYVNAGWTDSSAVTGYSAGGSAKWTINKLDLTTDSLSTLVSTLPAGRWEAASISNAGTAGYIAGGQAYASGLSGSFGRVNTGVKMVYSTTTTSTLAATISAATNFNSGASNGGVAGYSIGGSTGSVVSTIDKITFATDGIAALGTGLSAATRAGAALSDDQTAFYYSGGWTTTYADAIDVFALPSDTRGTTSAVLIAPRRNLMNGIAFKANAGFFAGGYNGATIGSYQSIDKLTFSTTTISAASGTLSTAGWYSGASCVNDSGL